MADSVNSTRPHRREFLLGLSGAAGFAGLGNGGHANSRQIIRELRAAPPQAPINEAYWARVASAFPLRPDLIHLNSANLAPSSTAVLEAAEALSRDVSADPSFENRVKFEISAERTRAALANMLGADRDEIAIPRNTSEANRTVIAGLDLGPDDEVVLWDQNHESNNVAWDVWARRRGFDVVRVATPRDPKEPEELIAPFAAALTPRAKVLAFSHVSNVSGIGLPARQLCEIARSQGVLTLVDGAQTFGMMDLDLHEMGCDFFTGSAHKWLAGPHEVGVLYIRSERIEDLWPSMVTHNWENMAQAGARKFECLGQRQDGRIDAFSVAIDLQDAIGRARIEGRVRFLADYLQTKLTSIGKPIEFLTPFRPEMSAGIVMFLIDVRDAAGVMAKLYDTYDISALAVPYGARTAVRFSPNIYNTLDQLDVAVEAIASIS